MDAEDWKELHKAIEGSEIENVIRLIENHAEEQYFSHEETSALYLAFSCEEYEIAKHLIRKGAKVYDDEVDELEIDLPTLNYLLLHSNKKSEKSCVYKLISLSQSPQGLDGENMDAVESMYEFFFKSEIIKLLMMVLERVEFDIVYDFESEDVNRLYRLSKDEEEILGLTLSYAKEIFIGAKNLFSSDAQKRAKVYGVVAEELCHLAMSTVFENWSKAYREEHTESIQEFQDIIQAVKSLADRSCHVESSVKNIFRYYPKEKWECELIARVPYILAMYGEETGRSILMESSEMSRLLSFYEENVIPKCREYTDPMLNTKPNRVMEQLMKKNDLITFIEKRIRPLKEDFPSFREYLDDFPSFREYLKLERKGISVLTTNCTKLCTLHVYHELKRSYEDLLKKKVLVFSRNTLEKEFDKIRDSLKGKAWEYLILVMDGKELNLWRFSDEYLYYFNEFLTKGMKIIMITSSQSIDQKFSFQKAISYKWDDLTDEYKYNFRKITYVFKGMEQKVWVEKEDFPKVFNDEDIMRIISEVIEVDDGKERFSQGYFPETYIQRVFMAVTVDQKIFEKLPSNIRIFLSGFSMEDFQYFLLNEKQVQWLEKSDDVLQDDKSVFIFRHKGATKFMDLVGKIPKKATIWLHHEEKVLYLKNSNSTCDEFKQYMKEVTFSENKILDFLECKRILIISDNAGYGKSTFVSNLINTVRKNRYDSWLWRVDFNKFSNNEKNPLSLANLNPSSDEEEVLEYLCQMLGLNNGLEKYLFRKFSGRAGRCFIFFDGYDEISSKYMDSALKLLWILKEKTAITLIITTRKHHQEELEHMLGTYSHQLVPLSRRDQLLFMDKFWKSKLKDPKGKGPSLRSKNEVTEKIEKIIEESKREKVKLEHQELIKAMEEIDLEKSLHSIMSDIDNLDFTKFAERILEKSSFDKEALELIGIPLHLYMIGSIHFNNNYNIEIQSDMYNLFAEFIEQKILIYLEEKEKMEKENKLKEKILKITKSNAFRIHIYLASQVIKIKACFASEMDDDDLELCIGLGIVYVHGGEIRFLHRTFAEFFHAESVRKSIPVEDFFELLSDDEFKVFRRFLSSSLKIHNFENITSEFFKIDWIIRVIESIFWFDPFNYIFSYDDRDSDKFCLVIIINTLLESFERTVKPGFVNIFIKKIESYLGRLPFIGVYLTVAMIKKLVNRNVNVNSAVLYSFVRFSEKADEVIDVLSGCILAENIGGSGSGVYKRSKKSKGNRDAEVKRLLALLRVGNGRGRSLCLCSLLNPRAEIFPRILKFFRDHLGEEQFIKEIIESDQYEREMVDYVVYTHSNRFCSTVKASHNVFGNGSEILFGKIIKFKVIDNALREDERYELSFSFEKVINVFKECFGSEKLKEFLVSKHSDGNNLINVLMNRSSGINIMKNLNIIKNILEENDAMKKFLRSISLNSMNALHSAALSWNRCFDDFIKFCVNILGKGEVNEMLFSSDDFGDCVFHILFRNTIDYDTLMSLNHLREIVGDNLFTQVLKTKNSRNENIFHLAAFDHTRFSNRSQYIRNMTLHDILQCCDPYLRQDEVKDMLLSKDEYGRSVIHLSFQHNSFEPLMKNLTLIKEYFGDEYLKKMLRSKNTMNENILHSAASNDNGIKYLKSSLSLHLCESDIADLFMERNKEGQTCLHVAANFLEINNLTVLIDYADELLRTDRSRFEELILAVDTDGNTFLHWLGKSDIAEKITILLREKLSEETFKKLSQHTKLLKIYKPTIG